MADNRLPLMLIAAGLGALLWWDAQSESDTPEVVASVRPLNGDGQGRAAAMQERDLDGSGANPLASLDKESLREMTQRPLFAPSRRRPPDAAPPSEAQPVFVPQPSAPPSAPEFMLLGVIRDGDRAIALLRSRSDARNLRVEAGDMIGGWEIAAVETLSVRLKRGDGTTHELRLPPR